MPHISFKIKVESISTFGTNGLNSDLKHLLKHMFRGGGAIFVKNKTNKLMKTLNNDEK